MRLAIVYASKFNKLKNERIKHYLHVSLLHETDKVLLLKNVNGFTLLTG